MSPARSAVMLGHPVGQGVQRGHAVDGADAGAGCRLRPADISTKPLVEHRAAITGQAPVNLALTAPNSAVRMGGAFSFMCTLRMDCLGSWSRVFDFSLTADEDSITAGAVGLTGDLHFTVFRGKRPFSTRVSNFFELGREATMLCSVSTSGHMRVFKDGALVGENEEGLAPLKQDRPRMIVGGHYLYTDQAFNGSLRDVKMWNQEVPWPTVESAEAPHVPKVVGGVPGDVDAMAVPAGTGKDVSANSFDVESLDAESVGSTLDAESVEAESFGSDTDAVEPPS